MSSNSLSRLWPVKALAPLVLAFLMAALAFAGPAHAATVANGDFESGTLTGWTVVNQDGGSGDWYTYSGTTSPQSGRQITVPPQGNFAATTDQTSPGSHVLYQDIALEENAEHTLSFILYYRNEASGFSTPDTLDYNTRPNQQYRVDILKPSAAPFSVDPADTLDSVYRTNVGDPNTLEPTPMTFDLSPYAGQTVRLRFAAVETEFFFRASVDDIKVDTEISPPPPAPAPEPDPQPDPDPDPKPNNPNACTIKGNDKNNVLRGTAGRDVVCGLGGNDVIRGLGGNDLIRGGAGNDVIYGGNGSDRILGQGGNDVLFGGSGQDVLLGGPGNNVLNGGAGKDVERGGVSEQKTAQKAKQLTEKLLKQILPNR